MLFDEKTKNDLKNLFSKNTDRFDELLETAGLDPKHDLVGADLSGADFSGSYIDGWNLSGCDLSGASFIGARIRNLKTAGAVGLDLTGAEIIEANEESAAEQKRDFNWIIQQINKGTRGGERWPFLQELLSRFYSDDRAWEFLRDHLNRERVGKYVSHIINAWEQRESREVGTKLRLELLRPGGNPYITVRARLLKELANRVGAEDEVLEIAKDMIEREGYWTSGIATMETLSKVFAGDPRASEILTYAISHGKFVSIGDATRALLKGFPTTTSLDFVEQRISDSDQNRYQRAIMIENYAAANLEPTRTWNFLRKIFETELDGRVRAAALRARNRYGSRSSSDSAEYLQHLAVEDSDDDVRTSALQILAWQGKALIPFLLERAMQDVEPSVRVTAIYLVQELGFNEPDWFLGLISDESDSVRGALLEWVLHNEAVVGEREIKEILVELIRSQKPSYAAARAGYLALKRWPDSRDILDMVAELYRSLPRSIGGWNVTLRNELLKHGVVLN
jgi:hypothetical protein